MRYYIGIASIAALMICLSGSAMARGGSHCLNNDQKSATGGDTGRECIPDAYLLRQMLSQAIRNMPKGSVISSGIWQVGQGKDGGPTSVAPVHKLTNHPLVTVYCAQNVVNAQFVVDNAENVNGGVVQHDMYAKNTEGHYAASLTLTQAKPSVSEGYYIVSGPAK